MGAGSAALAVAEGAESAFFFGGALGGSTAALDGFVLGAAVGAGRLGGDAGAASSALFFAAFDAGAVTLSLPAVGSPAPSPPSETSIDVPAQRSVTAASSGAEAASLAAIGRATRSAAPCTRIEITRAVRMIVEALILAEGALPDDIPARPRFPLPGSHFHARATPHPHPPRIAGASPLQMRRLGWGVPPQAGGRERAPFPRQPRRGRNRAPTKCNGLDGGSRRRRGEGSELPSHVNQT